MGYDRREEEFRVPEKVQRPGKFFTLFLFNRWENLGFTGRKLSETNRTNWGGWSKQEPWILQVLWAGQDHVPFSIMLGDFFLSQNTQGCPFCHSMISPLDFVNKALRMDWLVSQSKKAFCANVLIRRPAWHASESRHEPTAKRWEGISSSGIKEAGILVALPRTACAGQNLWIIAREFLARKHWANPLIQVRFSVIWLIMIYSAQHVRNAFMPLNLFSLPRRCREKGSNTILLQSSNVLRQTRSPQSNTTFSGVPTHDIQRSAITFWAWPLSLAVLLPRWTWVASSVNCNTHIRLQTRRAFTFKSIYPNLGVELQFILYLSWGIQLLKIFSQRINYTGNIGQLQSRLYSSLLIRYVVG